MSSPTVPAVTDATFDTEVAAADVPVLIDFWAAWCPHCPQAAQVAAELAVEVPAELGGPLKVVAVDTDANPDLARRYRVMSLPTLMLVHRGVEQTRLVGAHPKRRVQAAITPYLGRDPDRGDTAPTAPDATTPGTTSGMTPAAAG